MVGVIGGSPSAAQADGYDLVVIGSGIYGASATLAAARTGRRVLLLEREDFGGATSWNSLRILHGGLRYLQSLDLVRFRRSIEGRSWYADELPELIEPTACLMPLYDRGLRRRATLGPIMALNEGLRRRWGSRAELELLPPGGLLTREEVIERFERVRTEGLRGGALWYEGLMPQPQRVLIEILRRAAALGAVALNYVEATEWCVENGRIAGVKARDAIEFDEYAFRAPRVLNCAGPWAPALVAGLDPALTSDYHPSLAFNLLLDVPLRSTVSVAVDPPRGGRTYFLHPMDEWTLAGTYHAPMEEGGDTPDEAQIEDFLSDLRAAVPGLEATAEHVQRVMAGVLPARRPGTIDLASRSLHRYAARAGGPEGLHSLVGVKYTTAPVAAALAVRELLGDEVSGPGAAEPPSPDRRPADTPPVREVPGWTAFGLMAERDPEAAGALVDALVAEEGVRQADDLLLRRTDWGLDPRERSLADARVRQLRPKLFSPAE